jgi:hypothetical protein
VEGCNGAYAQRDSNPAGIALEEIPIKNQKYMTLDLQPLIADFCQEISSGSIDIYNEFSLQHELGIYLRSNLSEYKVAFERNVSHFKLVKTDFVKREIDIAITSKAGGLECVIELKYPRNGQVPESMFGFCKDIAFLEQLRRAGFSNAYFLAFADDKLFYSGSNVGIYGLFRGQVPIRGLVTKPTGARNESVDICGSYIATWNTIRDNTRYCLMNVTG